MKTAIIFCLVTLLVTGQLAHAQLDDLLKNQLIGTLVSKLGTLWQDGQFELMGYSCQYSVKPKIRKFKLKYKGKVWCPGWTGFSGSSSKNSRSGAVEHAVRDFINKASASGIITPEAAREQIERFRG